MYNKDLLQEATQLYEIRCILLLDGKWTFFLWNFGIDIIVELRDSPSNRIGIVAHSKCNLIFNSYWDPGQLNIAVRLLVGTVGESMSDFESEQNWLLQHLKFWQWFCWGFAYPGIWHCVCVSRCCGLFIFIFGEIPSNTRTHPQKTWVFRDFCSAVCSYKLCWLSSQYRWFFGGTALQAGRPWFQFPMVSLEFFIDIVLPAAQWSWGRLRL